MTTTLAKPMRARMIRRIGVATALAVPVLMSVSAVGATPRENGCNGLFEVARFATFKNVGDTHGHDTVHHQFELHGCAHHH
jgi:hypothetical protein